MVSLALASLAAPAAARDTAMPRQIDPPGETPLALVSCGVRQVLWMELYSVGLYVAPGAPLLAALDPQAPAALRVKVLDRNDFPPDIPEKWRRPLERALTVGEMARIRSAYDDLRNGDFLTLAYAPGDGVRLSVNGRALAHTDGHRLIDEMLGIWAGDDPVTGKLRRIALQHPC